MTEPHPVLLPRGRGRAATRALTRASALVAGLALLAACGGGGGGSSATPPSAPGGPIPQSGQSVSVTFAGTQTLGSARATRDLTSTPVTITLNGAVVGTGTLDNHGHAKITFTSAVPAGSTITITAGKVTATATLAMTAAGTVVLITVKPDGTITVTTAADKHDDGQVDNDDPEQETEDEDGHGNVTGVNSMNGNVLPANAPFTLVNACGTITVTPAGNAAASIKFEEKSSDGDDDNHARVRFEGAFTHALTFAVVSAAARIEVEVFDARGKTLIDVKAPITAFTSGAVSTSPCPSASPTATPSPTPVPTASPTPSPTATPTPTTR